MATLSSVYHDFPLLAKQSGFYFQLHSGSVNWSEIENLNLDEIVEKRNFQLLEQNLINVINCNVEREYDLKILDQNFVKLFKLAQLGVDYLSYCEMYLDKCVVLLQEQLSAFQEERELFKQESHKRKEEISKSRKKNKTSNYQCEKCEKVFISDVYLKFHDKRRHSNPNVPKSSGMPLKKFTDNCQQTEDEKILSRSLQTLVINKEKTSQESEDRDTVEHTTKIEKLEQELKELKEHFKKTEKTEVAQSNLSNVLYPFNIAGPNSTLMFLSSYLSQLTSGRSEINPEYPISCPVPIPTVPEFHKLKIDVPTQNHPDALENKSLLANITPLVFKSEKQKLCEPEKVGNKCDTENVINVHESSNKGKEDLECGKENVDPNIKKNITTRPLPPPRKLKKGIQKQSFNKKVTEGFVVPKNVIYKQEETAAFINQAVIPSPQVKDKLGQEIELDILEESKESLKKISKPEMNSTESSQGKNSVIVDFELKSMFKQIVARNSTKLQKLSKNIKRSLTNLYDSVSSNEKIAKKEESGEPSLRTAMVNELNIRLREFGVDPDWKGIPKKTMKKKIKVLKHRRKLCLKENPLYPVIRQRLEENIFENVKKNFRGKKPTSNISNKEQSINIDDATTQDFLPKEKSGFVEMKNCAMYNYKSDSESEASDFESNFIQATEQKTSPKPVITLKEFSSSGELEKKVDVGGKKEFNLSVFQVVGESLLSSDEDTHQKQVSIHKVDEVFTDSDSFLEESDNTIFKRLKN